MVASKWKTEEWPKVAEDMRAWVRQHEEMKEEPLHLAMVYGPDRDAEGVFLFEVIKPLIEDSVSWDHDLTDTAFSPAPGFPQRPNRPVHLVLTNKTEFREALKDGWPTMKEVLNVIARGDFEIVSIDEDGKALWQEILVHAGALNGVNHEVRSR